MPPASTMPKMNEMNKSPTQTFNKYITIEKKNPINKQTILELNTKRSFHINDISACPTEEDHRINTVNPIALADKDWTDEYKLMKLLKQQQKNMYQSAQIFGNNCNCN